jgi:hypothetical protein
MKRKMKFNLIRNAYDRRHAGLNKSVAVNGIIEPNSQMLV